MCKSSKVLLPRMGQHEQVYRSSRKSQQGYVTGVPRQEAGGTGPSTTGAALTLGKNRGGDRHTWWRSGKCYNERGHSYQEFHRELTCLWAGPPSLGQSMQVLEILQGNNKLHLFTYHSNGHSHLTNTYQMPTMWLMGIRNSSYPWGDYILLGCPIRKERGVNILWTFPMYQTMGFTCVINVWDVKLTIPILHVKADAWKPRWLIQGHRVVSVKVTSGWNLCINLCFLKN